MKVREIAEALALTLALMWFPLFRFSVEQVDSPLEFMFGCPLPWFSPSVAISLAHDVYLVPLLIDLAIWGLVAVLLLRRWARPGMPKANWLRIGVTTAIGGGGLFGLFSTLVVLSMQPSFVAWYPKDFPIRVTGLTLIWPFGASM